MLLTSKLTPEQIERLHAHTIARPDEMARRSDRGDRRRSFPRRSRPSAKAWRRTGATASRARCAARRFSASNTPTNEANYCPTCQTGGKLLADRGLSRLLKDDWPKSLEELERMKTARARR